MFRFINGRMVFFSADGGGGGGGADDDADLKDKEKDFETYVLTLPEEHRPTARTQHEKLITAMKSERTEKKKEAKRRKELEDAELKRQEKDLSEIDLAKKEKLDADARAEKAEAKFKTQLIKTRFVGEAGKLQYGEGEKKSKFIDPEKAYLLAVAEGAEMAIDESEKITGVSEALVKMAKENPWMLEAQTTQQKQPPGPTKGKLPGSEQQEQAKQSALEKKRAGYPPL